MNARKFSKGVASAALAAALFISAAHSQALIQAGPTTAGHIPQYFTQGTSQAVVGDGGGAGGGPVNANPSEFGITSRGPTLPVVGGGTGPNGEHFCMYDAPTTTPGGFHALCYDPDSPLTSGGGILSYGAYGGATPEPFDLYINGTLINLSGLLSTLSVGVTNLVGGSSGSIVYDNAGKVGELPVGSGVTAALAIQPNVTGGFAQYPVAASTLTGSIPVSKGGTGLTTLQQNLVLIGNGTNAVTFAATSGNHTQLASVSGTPLTGDCASWNNGDLIDAGAACGGGSGGSGTVTSGTAGQLAAYAANGTTVSGLNSINFAQGGLPCDTLEVHGGGTAKSAGVNLSAWNSFISGLPSSGGCLQLGPGQYQFSSNLNGNLSGVSTLSIFGTGPGSTILRFPSGGGMIFAPSTNTAAVLARDFTLMTDDTSGGNSAILLSVNATSGPGTKSVFSNIETTGNGTGGYFKWGYELRNATGVDIISPTINGLGSVSPAGGGVLCQGTAPSSTSGYTTGLNVVNPLVTGATDAFEMGNYCQNMSVTNMNVSGSTVGVFTPSGVSGSLFNLRVSGGTASVTASAVQLLSPVSSVTVQGMNVPVSASQTGLALGGAIGGSISGNVIVCGSTSLTAGIIHTGSGLAMTGNEIALCGTAIALASPASGDNVQSNVYVSNTNKVVNSSASASNFGSCTGVSGPCTAGATP